MNILEKQYLNCGYGSYLLILTKAVLLQTNSMLIGKYQRLAAIQMSSEDTLSINLGMKN